jgi:hypothetical protein
MIPFGLGPLEAALVAAGMVVAGYVRGYSGFGFAALVMAFAGLVTNPVPFVPVVILADIAMTAAQARGIRREVDWRRVGTLFLGALVGVPVGVQVMAGVGADVARAILSVFILAMCALMLAGWHLRRPPGDAAHVGVGVVSGLANGAAVGGLPVAVFFAAAGVPPAVFRATVIAYFTALDLWSLPVMAVAGLVTAEAFRATLMGLPFMVLGLWLGGRRFLAASPSEFRRFAVMLLGALALAGLARSLA